MTLHELETIKDYINRQRQQNQSNEVIHDKLTVRGWPEAAIVEAFTAVDDPDLPPPPPAQNDAPLPASTSQPIAVTQRFTTRGLEYNIMIIALAFAAIALGICLHSFTNTAFGVPESSWESEYVAVAASALIVSLPIFLLLFLRLRRFEKQEPLLRQDSTRRRAIQVTLVVSFIWGISKIITTLYELLSGKYVHESRGCYDYYSQNCTSNLSDGSYLLLQVVHLLITLGIAGGIFAYYWIDEHRKDQQ